MTKIIGLIATVAFMSSSVATANIATIKSISKKTGRILIVGKNLRGLGKGDLIQINSQCKLRVDRTSRNRAILNSKKCSTKRILSKGIKLDLQFDSATKKRNSKVASRKSKKRTRSN